MKTLARTRRQTLAIPLKTDEQMFAGGPDVIAPVGRLAGLTVKDAAVRPRTSSLLPPKGRDHVSAPPIDDVELARALHVLCITHWIGGVAFVTLVVVPLARAQNDGAKGWALFEGIENRFAAQVRWSIPLAGASGLWMTWRLGLWAAFADRAFWWMDAMVLVWAVFMTAIFVIEPIAHGRVAAEAARDPKGVLRRLGRAHLVLLAAAAVTIAGSMAGSHGGLWR